MKHKVELKVFAFLLQFEPSSDHLVQKLVVAKQLIVVIKFIMNVIALRQLELWLLQLLSILSLFILKLFKFPVNNFLLLLAQTCFLIKFHLLFYPQT